jgi:acetylornithine deacetylase/succinyl-diaminopimelate desuccinylase-like protein
VKDGEVYARGASDDKGQAFYVVTAMKALFETGEIPDLNIKLFIEGEEECGAKGSVDIMFKKKEEMKADHLLIVDGGLPDKVTPSITLGLRGIMAMQIACRNSHIDLHSGVYGGIALNPNRALVTLLAKLWDEKGRVAVPGFYDDIDVPSKDDLAMFDQSFDKEGIIKCTGLKAFQGDPGYSLWESNMIRPVLEINGVSGGYTGSGFKTVIPKEAFAKLSARLVPSQDPLKVAEKISAFLKQNCPEGLDLEVAWDHGGLPVRSSPKSKVSLASQQAYAEVFGKPCLIQLCGASIPSVPDLVKACGADMACVGVGLSTDNIHAPNEHFGMDRFELGFLTTIKILQNLCTI